MKRPVSEPDRRHILYEAAVQTPEQDIAFFERVFARRVGRAPIGLREDFCGTALLSARWVESDDEREALAVDRDREVQESGRRRHLAGLDEGEAERLQLVCGDARALSDRCFDLVVAMNFSWAIFEDDALLDYLRAARECLADDGLLVLGVFGGDGLRGPRREARALDGFTYVWEQLEGSRDTLDARIHFELEGGEVLRDAFAYRFRLRSLARLTELLAEAGLSGIELHVDDPRGRTRRRRTEPRDRLWSGKLVSGR